MTEFFEKILETKKRKNEDIIITKIDEKIISLRVIDESNETLELSTKWRTDNQKWFQTSFKPTIENTRKWIKETILNDNDRILFMIFFDNKKIGQTGLDRYVIKDNSIDITGTLKDPCVKDRRIMETTRKALCEWAFEYLDVSKIIFRVFSDNYRNINLIERCGALTVNSIPMKKLVKGDHPKWIELKSDQDEDIAERYLNIMEIKKENFKKD
tara:strand:+ start:611 stop:1249 length:639 start_codon:yes stop_codon:yes gene_type:complete